MPQTLFISDLHLAVSQPATTELFLGFMHGINADTEALYVLGDLFEHWIGDDSMDEPFHQTIVTAFATVAKNGTALFFMHGNRDFLLGQAFCDASHGTLLANHSLIDLYGIPTLLMHGDLLCTDDTDYMRFRAMVRQPAWQNNFLTKTLDERQIIVENLRIQSKEATRLKPTEITDVALPTVEATLRNYGYPKLIHGHTHRPARHIHTVDGKTCERWVLTDWYDEKGGYLKVTPNKWEMLPL